jgi:hypothetical protein
MAVTAFTRFRFLWGALEAASGDNVYTSAQRATLGESAAVSGGIGGRRVQLVFTRTPPGSFAEDVAVMHLDFLNMTAGAPDDTWTTSDFTTLEGIIGTWWTALKPRVVSSCVLKELRWYRVGAGVVPPNPPVRITPIGTAGTGGTQPMPPQVSCSISFHVGPRRSWGRTYLPHLTAGELATTGGLLNNTAVDGIANATNTMVTSAAAADFVLVVYAAARGLLAVEQIAVDNIYDIIRRRRWEHPTYRKALP